MARRISISQYNNMVRQAVNKQKQAVNKYNQHVRNYNNKVRQAVNKYNQEVRKYNANRQKLINAFNQVRNRPVHTTVHVKTYSNLHSSTELLRYSYQQLEQEYSPDNSQDENLMLDLPLREATNSVFLYNSITGRDQDDGQGEYDLQKTVIEDLLYRTSKDLGDRWIGAIHSLNPNNPEAARHFCTSVREIFIGLIDIHAPDQHVATLPYCEYNDSGAPSRRTKVRYLLSNKSIQSDSLEIFVENDVKDLMELLYTLSSGTHGAAGKFDIPQLLKLKKRAEDAINFIGQLTV